MTQQFIEGDVVGGQVQQVLENILSLGGNLEPAMRQIAGYMENQVRLGFRQSKSPYGAPWAPIHHREGQPLIDTRTLLSSISSDYGGDFAEVGTNVEYAPHQQFGDPGEKGITGRPYLPIQDDEVVLPAHWEGEILGILEGVLEGLTNG